MTFDQIVTDIKDRLNLSSTEATTRIGRACNRKYRIITSAIGMQLSRRATVQKTVTIGVSTVTFTNCEKIINVVNRAVSPYRTLDEVTLDELQEDMPFTNGAGPTKYAIQSHTADTVTILINRVPQTAYTLYADVHQAISDLSGSQEPAFPESFHDIIIEGVLADELRKMEKPALATIAQREYERLLSDLRMWIAKSGFLEIYQGKTANQLRTGGAAGSAGGSTVNGALSYTQTGLITFDRDPSAPFAVTSGSAVVPNFNADMVDGLHSTDFVGLADNVTVSGIWNFDGQADFDAQVDMSGATLLLPQTDVPAQTTEGSIIWDTDNDLLTIGTGLGRKTMVDTDTVQTIANKSISLGSNTLTGTTAQFNAALSDGDFATLAGTETLTNKTISGGTLSGTLAGTPTFSGVLTISAKPNINAGLQFPTTPASSADPNTLDEYEEGSFNPTFGGSSTESGQAYTDQIGRYVKVGKLVHYQIRLTLSTLGTITGNVRVKNLPFTSLNSTNAASAVSVGWWANMTLSTIWIGGFIIPNTNQIDLTTRTSAGTSTATLSQGDLANNTAMIISGTYVADV